MDVMLPSLGNQTKFTFDEFVARHCLLFVVSRINFFVFSTTDANPIFKTHNMFNDEMDFDPKIADILPKI
jgi:hypothetical protein